MPWAIPLLSLILQEVGRTSQTLLNGILEEDKDDDGCVRAMFALDIQSQIVSRSLLSQSIGSRTMPQPSYFLGEPLLETPSLEWHV
jgi:hypothetical protein